MTAPAGVPPGGAQDERRDTRSFGASAFESSTFDRRARPAATSRWLGWRRRALAAVAVLACLGVLAFARWLAAAPQVDATWRAGAAGELVLASSADPVLDARRGQVVKALSVPGGMPMEVSADLLQRSARWQPDDEARARQVALHERVAVLREQAAPGRRLQLHWADGSTSTTALAPLGVAGLGWLFWPLAALTLLLVLAGAVLVLARTTVPNVLFSVMTLCQAGNLLFIAVETARGLGLPAGAAALDMPLRITLDLCTGGALVHAFALLPQGAALRRWAVVGGWLAVLSWLLLARADLMQPLWWWAQAACVAITLAGLYTASMSLREQPNPYALAMRRFSSVVLATLVLATAAVALSSRLPAVAQGLAVWAPVVWVLFLASMLLLTPFLARSRQVLREFALLAGISTVATSLDLLFVAVFALGPFTSLAIAVFVALGLYAAARQWILGQLLGRSMVTTERAFDQIYRAAREVQARPASHAQRLGQLLRDLFDPLEMARVDRVPARARIINGGESLVVAVRSTSEPARSGTSASGVPADGALLLRFAHRGQRLFTEDDARLADRVVEQLRRAVAYDMAVERGRFEERQRIAQDLHDDIGARLLTLMYQAQTPEMEDYIRHTLQDLKTLTRGLAAAEHRLSHAAGEWKADLTQRLTVAHVGLDWNFDHDRDLRLTVVQWSALTRVLRELVTNAIYHGHATRVAVNFKLEGPMLTLQVADDGEGRAPEAWAHGLGLGGVRKRVKVLGGEVAWKENSPRGIVCSVRVRDFAGQA